MTLKTRIEPIEDWIGASVSESLSPQAQSEALADFAREKIAETGIANGRALGRVPPHKTFVDGRPEAPLESVKPKGGVIVAEWELVADVLSWIGRTLIQRSPVVSGAYRRGHRLFADGREVALVSVGGQIPDAEEYVFLNLVPYARKIEIGRTQSGRPFVVKVPNRIYERTAADARRRFGNIARIGFSFRSPLMSYQPAGSGGSAASRRGGVERQSRTPAIIVTLR